MADVPSGVISPGAVPNEHTKGSDRKERARYAEGLVNFYDLITFNGALEAKLKEASITNPEDVLNTRGPILRNKTTNEKGEEIEEVWQIKAINDKKQIFLKLVTKGPKDEKTEELVVKFNADQEGKPDSSIIFTLKEDVETGTGNIRHFRPKPLENNLPAYKAGEALLVHFAKFINPVQVTPPPLIKAA